MSEWCLMKCYMQYFVYARMVFDEMLHAIFCVCIYTEWVFNAIFCVGITKCLQLVICQAVLHFVIVDFLNVLGTLGLRPIPVKSGMDVLTTR